MSKLNMGQRKARDWFESLTEVSRDDAVALLKDGDTLTIADGFPPSIRVTRAEAIAMIETGVRMRPVSQAGMRFYAGHNLVVIDPSTGFPIQLQTKSAADLMALPVPAGYHDIE